MTEQVFSRVAAPGVFTHGLAMKPGKPTILGYDTESDTILAGLPGHPVSALMVFRFLLGWLVKQLTGQKEPYPVPAAISCNLAGSPGRTTFQPVALRLHSGGGYIAEPVFGKSGMISTLTNADGYIVIEQNKEGLREGEAVQVFLWE
jgi:molybdopterin molybdotransferase